MKMITLPKLRDALSEMKYEVRVPEEIAVSARVPIDRMVASASGLDLSLVRMLAGGYEPAALL